MADYTNISRLITELRQQIDRLDAEVQQSARENGATAPAGGRERSLNSAPAAEAARGGRAGLAAPHRVGKLLVYGGRTDPETIAGGQITQDFPNCCAVGGDRYYYCSGNQ